MQAQKGSRTRNRKAFLGHAVAHNADFAADNAGLMNGVGANAQRSSKRSGCVHAANCVSFVASRHAGGGGREPHPALPHCIATSNTFSSTIAGLFAAATLSRHALPCAWELGWLELRDGPHTLLASFACKFWKHVFKEFGGLRFTAIACDFFFVLQDFLRQVHCSACWVSC